MQKNIKIWVLIIAVITFVSGLVQIIVPIIVLRFIGGEINSYTIHFFAIIGMFMFLFGAMMLQALYSPYENKAAIIWSAIQKFGASIAVLIGVVHGLFSTLALGVALFDLFSGLIFMYYLYSLRKP